jgi:hypothetical protein
MIKINYMRSVYIAKCVIYVLSLVSFSFGFSDATGNSMVDTGIGKSTL